MDSKASAAAAQAGGAKSINLAQSIKKKKPTPESKKEDLRICPLCGKPIFDLAGALAAREDGQPIHFDCALEQLAKEEQLGPDEN